MLNSRISEASFGPTNSKNIGVFNSPVQLKSSHATNKDLNIDPTSINEPPITTDPQESNLSQNRKVSPTFGGGKSFVFEPPINNTIETFSRNPSASPAQTLNTREATGNPTINSLPTLKPNDEKSKGKKIEFIKKSVLSPKSPQDTINKSIEQDPKKPIEKAIAASEEKGTLKKPASNEPAIKTGHGQNAHTPQKATLNKIPIAKEKIQIKVPTPSGWDSSAIAESSDRLTSKKGSEEARIPSKDLKKPIPSGWDTPSNKTEGTERYAVDTSLNLTKLSSPDKVKKAGQETPKTSRETQGPKTPSNPDTNKKIDDALERKKETRIEATQAKKNQKLDESDFMLAQLVSSPSVGQIGQSGQKFTFDKNIAGKKVGLIKSRESENMKTDIEAAQNQKKQVEKDSRSGEENKNSNTKIEDVNRVKESSIHQKTDTDSMRTINDKQALENKPQDQKILTPDLQVTSKNQNSMEFKEDKSIKGTSAQSVGPENKAPQRSAQAPMLSDSMQNEPETFANKDIQIREEGSQAKSTHNFKIPEKKVKDKEEEERVSDQVPLKKEKKQLTIDPNLQDHKEQKSKESPDVKELGNLKRQSGRIDLHDFPLKNDIKEGDIQSSNQRNSFFKEKAAFSEEAKIQEQYLTVGTFSIPKVISKLDEVQVKKHHDRKVENKLTDTKSNKEKEMPKNLTSNHPSVSNSKDQEGIAGKLKSDNNGPVISESSKGGKKSGLMNKLNLKSISKDKKSKKVKVSKDQVKPNTANLENKMATSEILQTEVDESEEKHRGEVSVKLSEIEEEESEELLLTEQKEDKKTELPLTTENSIKDSKLGLSNVAKQPESNLEDAKLEEAVFLDNKVKVDHNKLSNTAEQVLIQNEEIKGFNSVQKPEINVRVHEQSKEVILPSNVSKNDQVEIFKQKKETIVHSEENKPTNKPPEVQMDSSQSVAKHEQNTVNKLVSEEEIAPFLKHENTSATHTKMDKQQGSQDEKEKFTDTGSRSRPHSSPKDQTQKPASKHNNEDKSDASKKLKTEKREQVSIQKQEILPSVSKETPESQNDSKSIQRVSASEKAQQEDPKTLVEKLAEPQKEISSVLSKIFENKEIDHRRSEQQNVKGSTTFDHITEKSTQVKQSAHFEHVPFVSKTKPLLPSSKNLNQVQEGQSKSNISRFENDLSSSFQIEIKQDLDRSYDHQLIINEASKKAKLLSKDNSQKVDPQNQTPERIRGTDQVLSPSSPTKTKILINPPAQIERHKSPLERRSSRNRDSLLESKETIRDQNPVSITEMSMRKSTERDFHQQKNHYNSPQKTNLSISKSKEPVRHKREEVHNPRNTPINTSRDSIRNQQDSNASYKRLKPPKTPNHQKIRMSTQKIAMTVKTEVLTVKPLGVVKFQPMKISNESPLSDSILSPNLSVNTRGRSLHKIESKSYLKTLVKEDEQYDKFYKAIKMYKEVPNDEEQCLEYLEDLIILFREDYQEDFAETLAKKLWLLLVHNLIRIFLKFKRDINAHPRKSFIRLGAAYYAVKGYLKNLLADKRRASTQRRPSVGRSYRVSISKNEKDIHEIATAPPLRVSIDNVKGRGEKFRRSLSIDESTENTGNRQQDRTRIMKEQIAEQIVYSANKIHEASRYHQNPDESARSSIQQQGRGGKLQRSISVEPRNRDKMKEGKSESAKSPASGQIVQNSVKVEKPPMKAIDTEKIFKRLLFKLGEDDLNLVKAIKHCQIVLTSRTADTQIVGSCLLFFVIFLKTLVFTVLNEESTVRLVPAILHKDILNVLVYDQKTLPQLENYITLYATRHLQYDKKTLRREGTYIAQHRDINITNLLLYLTNFINYPDLYYDIVQIILRQKHSKPFETAHYLILAFTFLRDKLELFTDKTETIRISKLIDGEMVFDDDLRLKPDLEKYGEKIRGVALFVLDALLELKCLPNSLYTSNLEHVFIPSESISLLVILTEARLLNPNSIIMDRTLKTLNLQLRTAIKSLMTDGEVNMGGSLTVWSAILSNIKHCMNPNWFNIKELVDLDNQMEKETSANKNQRDMSVSVKEGIYTIMKTVYEIVYFLRLLDFTDKDSLRPQSSTNISLYGIIKSLFYSYTKAHIERLSMLQPLIKENKTEVMALKASFMLNLLLLPECEQYENVQKLEQEFLEIVQTVGTSVNQIDPSFMCHVVWILKTVNRSSLQVRRSNEWLEFLSLLKRVPRLRETKELPEISEDAAIWMFFPQLYLIRTEESIKSEKKFRGRYREETKEGNTEADNTKEYQATYLFNLFFEKLLKICTSSPKTNNSKLNLFLHLSRLRF